MEFTRNEIDVQLEIEALQAKTSGLRFHRSRQTASSGQLTTACEICSRMKYMSFQLGFRCNAKCPFCFIDTDPTHFIGPNASEEELRAAFMQEFHRQADALEGVALAGGEPLLYLEEIEAISAEMHATRPELHLWSCTNGILADEEHLTRLRACGINELHFNLAATDYGTDGLEGLKRARDIFDSLSVEVPAYPAHTDLLMETLPALERIGIDQLNLKEFVLTAANIDSIPGEGYESGPFFARRYFLYGSRHLTYEIMRHCHDQGYSFTVNDCTPPRV